MCKEFDRFVLRAMPHFIAVQYQKLLGAETPEQKIRHALRVYELGLRALAIGAISQYLICDADRFSDLGLNQLFLTKLPNATLDTWQQIFFSTLKAYEGKRSLFFIPELYDFFWDSSSTPPQPRSNIDGPFTRLTQIRNDLDIGRMLPTNEAGWQALCTETLELLHTVLFQFAFLENYDLIRITGRDGNLYWYDQYTGLQAATAQTPIQTQYELGQGWFYFSKQNRDFLKLHPLLIFWEELETDLAVPSPQRDVAIYNRFLRDRLQYLIASMWETVTDEKSVIDFVRLLYYTIEQVKQERQQAERLTWWQLQEIARAISERRMASALDKYRSDLYLQRDKTKAALEDFLASDEVCFILTGKSGVGKSNLLLALAEEYGQKRPDVCLLMYNGAKLDPKESLTATIGRDFENYLQLTGHSDERGILNIWREIARIDGIGSRKVILCIDAINENTEAKALLRQIDELVESLPWPWLKVVITSRPEAWRVIKRGVRLAEARYYREAGKEKLGVEMEPFSYSQELEPFTRHELPRAYEKYRRVYNLQTGYEDLSAEVRPVLQDPLVLRLVADMYQGQEIPLAIKAGEVYQKYIDHLIRTERLAFEDVRFLEWELMPLMIREGHYANTITAKEINQATMTDGQSLFELIYSEAKLSDGRRINQSYVNLVDAEVLERRGEPQDYEIGFKYERFYDAYAGRLLFERCNSSPRPHEDYRELINSIGSLPYLWGATKVALWLELKSGNIEVFRQLLGFEDYVINEIIAITLEEFALDYGEEANSILLEIFTRARPSRLGQVWRRIRGVKPSADESTRKLAIEVAYRINYDEILASGLNSTLTIA
jgi:hypothetical protein